MKSVTGIIVVLALLASALFQPVHAGNRCCGMQGNGAYRCWDC